ncbi:MAG: CRISPR-associated helicase Cas3', partial [Enterovibrio sp.]
MIRRRKKSGHENEPDQENLPSFEYFLAKTNQTAEGQILPGQTVFDHCKIVGEIAKRLLALLPLHVQQHLAIEGSALLAAVHDLGKVSPTFQLKLFLAINSNPDTPIPDYLTGSLGIDEYQWGGHAGASRLALEALSNNAWVPLVAGQHHGFNAQVGMQNACSSALGGKLWQAQREILFQALGEALNQTLPDISSAHQAHFLAGLTSVADWIGSGHWFNDPQEPWLDKILPAIEAAGFVPFHIKKNLAFGDIFTGPKNEPYQANDCQISLAKYCNSPGVYVLEAPMGLGKTEAALYAAYQLLAKGEAGGIYFALPTQLTSNKIWERFDRFLHAILDKDSPHRRSHLLHANARLVEQELGKEGAVGHSWFDQNKRGLLAPFAVGTLDQALMAAMNVKHGFVRAYGLAGKVVILDEVHSYDAYTSLILDSLIKLLRQLHCTVIILSATLSQHRRSELLQVEVKNADYPLLTACQDNQISAQPFELPLSSPPSQKINIKLVSVDNESAIEEALARAQAGQQVLWIENTVDEAQSCYLYLAARAAEIGIECGLLHSRFSPAHRQQHENHWVAAFGKEGWEARSFKGRILIGTQVLEQSLDIDADFLLTRIAPTDMILQRLGRLWRHLATPRAAGAKCEAWILTPTLDEALISPQQAFGPTALVYAPYILCRSLEIWQKAGASFSMTLPTDIRRYIDATYTERDNECARFLALRHEFYQGSAIRKGID